jgi:ubiquinone/menaquinone biosynthesis C-methylase UbiE
MKFDVSLLNIPFDQYSRQFQVAQMVNALRVPGQTFKILDVGGYKGKTAEFFPNDKVTVLDVYDVDEPNYVKGNGLALPFDAGSFDIVVNFDVLEHIASSDRPAFIDQCARVASRAFFICAPHKTPENEYAEHELNNLYVSLHGKNHEWLREHIDYTLPDMPSLVKHLAKQKVFISEYTSNDTLTWLLMQSAIFFNSKYPHAALTVQAINHYYNETYPFDGAGRTDESYRLILCCVKAKKDHDLLTKHFADVEKPLTVGDKLRVMQKILEYHAELLAKLEEEKVSYHDHHEQAKLRILELEAQNQQLVEENDRLRSNTLVKLSDTTKRGIRRISKKDD